jgi:hypothetical protein
MACLAEESMKVAESRPLSTLAEYHLMELRLIIKQD